MTENEHAEGGDYSVSRDQAVDLVDVFLKGIEQQGREMDQWEKYLLTAALKSIEDGIYEIAEIDVEDASLPIAERSPTPLPPDPDAEGMTVAQARQSLENLRRRQDPGGPMFF